MDTYNPSTASVFLRPDNFAVMGGRHADDIDTVQNGNKNYLTETYVRRPYSGITFKKNTIATLSVVTANGYTIPLVAPNYQNNSSNVQAYADFVLESVDENRVEKNQVVDTFGDSYVFFFGEQPRLITISGTLLNTVDYEWKSQFWLNYDRNLRGTQLVQHNARAYLSFGTTVVEGYPTQVSARDVADQPHMVKFSMQMFVTNNFDYSNPGSIYRPPRGLTADPAPVYEEIVVNDSSAYASSVNNLQKNVDKKNLDQSVDSFVEVGGSSGRAGRGVADATKKPSIIKNAVNKIHDTLFTMGGRVDDLANTYNSAQRSSFMATTNAYGAVAEVIAAAEDPEFTADFYFGTFIKSISDLTDGAKKFITAAAEGAPTDELAAQAAKEAGKALFIGAPIGVGAVAVVSSSVVDAGTTTKGGSSRIDYVGHSGETFGSVTSKYKKQISDGGGTQAAVGSAYNGPRYDAGYEPVYGGKNYKGAIENDPAMEKTLSDAFGDTNNSGLGRPRSFVQEPDVHAPVESFKTFGMAGSEIDLSSVGVVYEYGVSNTYTGPTEDAVAATQKPTLKVIDRVATSGIRGVDDVNGDIIEPVV